jgi:hypothetical protein
MAKFGKMQKKTEKPEKKTRITKKKKTKRCNFSKSKRVGREQINFARFLCNQESFFHIKIFSPSDKDVGVIAAKSHLTPAGRAWSFELTERKM